DRREVVPRIFGTIEGGAVPMRMPHDEMPHIVAPDEHEVWNPVAGEVTDHVRGRCYLEERDAQDLGLGDALTVVLQVTIGTRHCTCRGVGDIGGVAAQRAVTVL